MDNETREQIALIRYKMISPVLAEPGRVQNEYFRTQAAKRHEFPRLGSRKVKVSTLKAWLKAFRKNGFDGLKPRIRSDKGRPRKAGPQLLDAIRVHCKAYPYITVKKLHERIMDGNPPIHYNTLLRIVKEEQLLNFQGHVKVVQVLKIIRQANNAGFLSSNKLNYFYEQLEKPFIIWFISFYCTACSA
jgi:transposase